RVTHKQDSTIKFYKKQILEVSGDSTFFARDFNENDTIKYPALAKTLKRIQKNGRDEFYKGETAEKLVKFIREKGGYITMDDLAKYEVKWREPVVFNYKELRVISMSPPSSGGITLA